MGIWAGVAVIAAASLKTRAKTDNDHFMWTPPYDDRIIDIEAEIVPDLQLTENSNDNTRIDSGPKLLPESAGHPSEEAGRTNSNEASKG